MNQLTVHNSSVSSSLAQRNHIKLSRSVPKSFYRAYL